MSLSQPDHLCSNELKSIIMSPSNIQLNRGYEKRTLTCKLRCRVCGLRGGRLFDLAPDCPAAQLLAFIPTHLASRRSGMPWLWSNCKIRYNLGVPSRMYQCTFVATSTNFRCLNSGRTCHDMLEHDCPHTEITTPLLFAAFAALALPTAASEAGRTHSRESG